MKMALSAIFAALIALGGCASRPIEWRPLDDLSAAQLYQRLCSSCHGRQASGDGPMAIVIGIRAPDLTRLARRDGGEFPTEDVRRAIDGRLHKSVHHRREMPVWGWQLHNGTARDDPTERARASMLINRLVEYLRSVQST